MMDIFLVSYCCFLENGLSAIAVTAFPQKQVRVHRILSPDDVIRFRANDGLVIIDLASGHADADVNALAFLWNFNRLLPFFRELSCIPVLIMTAQPEWLKTLYPWKCFSPHISASHLALLIQQACSGQNAGSFRAVYVRNKKFTHTEQQIVSFILQGYDISAVSSLTRRSRESVFFYRGLAMKKVGLRTRHDFTRLARDGIVLL